MAKPIGTPTPIPAPTAIWLDLGRVVGEEVAEATAEASEVVTDTGSIADGLEKDSTEEVAERAAVVVGVVLVEADPMVVSIEAGPGAKENSRDSVEQHPVSLKPQQQ